MNLSLSHSLLLLVLLNLSMAANAQCDFGGFCPTGMPQWTQDLTNGCVALSEKELDCITGTMPNGPSPFQPPAWCTTIENNIFFPFVAQSTNVLFDVGVINCQSGNGALQAAILDCNLNFFSDCFGNIPDGTSQIVNNTTPLNVGTTYLLMIDGSAGSICDFVINGAFLFDLLGSNVCIGGYTGQNIGTYTSNQSGTWSVNPPSAGVILSPNPGSFASVEWLQPGQHEVCISACPNGNSTCLNVNIGSVSETFQTYDICESECIFLDGTAYCIPGEYQVVYATPSGCDSIVHITLNVLPNSTVNEFIPLPCDGEYHFSGDTLTDLYWAHEFYFTNAVGCDSLHTITLLPTSVYGEAGTAQTLSCTPSATVQLQSIVYYPPFNYSIEWSTTNGHIVSGQNTLTPTVDAIGTYCMTITDLTTGCKMTDCTQVLHGNEDLVFAFSNPKVPCNPLDTFQLSLTTLPGSTDVLTWTTLDGNITGATDNPSIFYNQQGTYCLTITKPNGCDSTACVAVYSDLSVDILAPTNHCPGPDIHIVFDPSYSHQVEAILYWQPNNEPIREVVLPQAGPVQQVLFFDGTTIIKAWVVDENGCTSDTSYHTIVSDPPNIVFEITQEGCDLATVTATEPTDGYSYEWSNGIAGIDATSISVAQTGIYSVTIWSGNGCRSIEDVYVETDYTGTCAYLKGSVKQDEFGNCSPDVGEQPLANWTIIAAGTNDIFYGTTDVDGNYWIPVLPDNYTVSAIPVSGNWDICQNAINAALPMTDEEITIDFLADVANDCPLLRVDITSSIIRRCFNNLYSVSYCNDGTVTATDAYIDVDIDGYMTLQNATIAYTDLGNNLVRFPIGNVEPNECGQFHFRTKTDCSAPLGFTHCTQAHIYPDSLCTPIHPLWSGAALEVKGTCGDSTRFTIKNVGTGTMSVPLTYSIFRNAKIHLYRQAVPLAIGETHIVSLPADTATWRVEVEQDSHFPHAPWATASVQGCTPNGLPDNITSFVNALPSADQDAAIDEDCRMNVASFDPNDKQATPIGYTDAHYIADGTGLEYRIRFQNTGSDTAFMVVLKDTLSDLLDISTLKMGASSHPYIFELFGHGVLKISFPNIQLPHLGIDELGSMGFVEFKISPKAGLLPLTVIENAASIYFDRNAPVHTNSVFHTIEKPVRHGYELVELCKGDEWYGIPYFADAFFNETFTYPEYDSMLWTEIQVTPPFDSTITKEVCFGKTFPFNGEVYQGSGTYFQTVSSVVECDTHFTIIIIERAKSCSIFEDQFCVGGTYEMGGQVIDEPGVYDFEFTDQFGCDSTVTLFLTHADPIFENVEQEICQGSTFSFFGEELATTGQYTATTTNAEGCEVNVVLNLQANLLYESMMTGQFCEGTTYEFFGEILDSAGQYEKLLSAVDGCDSLVRLELIENTIFETSTEAMICTGSTFHFHGEMLDSTGHYEALLISSAGCDSLVSLDLEVVNSFDISLSTEICEGDSVTFNGEVLYEEGHYPAEFVSTAGCDSLVTLSLIVWPNHLNERTATICYGDSALFNGQSFYETGTYTETFTSIHGCDSTETFELAVLDSAWSEMSITICEGESVEFQGDTLNVAGIYTTVLPTALGCDSTVTLHLEVEPIYVDTLTEYILYGQVFQGVEIVDDTIFTQQWVAQNGCDSLVTWVIYVFTPTHGNLSERIGLSIFPNPADGRFFVKFGLAKDQPVAIRVMDVVGQKIIFEKQKGIFTAGDNLLEISSEGWASGIYLVGLVMGEGIAFGKVAVE